MFTLDEGTGVVSAAEGKMFECDRTLGVCRGISTRVRVFLCRTRL